MLAFSSMRPFLFWQQQLSILQEMNMWQTFMMLIRCLLLFWELQWQVLLLQLPYWLRTKFYSYRNSCRTDRHGRISKYQIKTMVAKTDYKTYCRNSGINCCYSIWGTGHHRIIGFKPGYFIHATKFAVVPLVMFTNDKAKMGEFVNKPFLKVGVWVISIIIIVLYLLYQTFTNNCYIRHSSGRIMIQKKIKLFKNNNYISIIIFLP
jgi:hypothetical protein